MSDSEDLLSRIRLGEDTSLEFKEVRLSGTRVVGPGRDRLADEIAAMANSRGGTLVLGVDDESREVVGIPLEALDAVERLLSEIGSDSIEPSLSYYTFRMELPDSQGVPRAVLRVEVPRSLFVHRSPGGYMHRQGSSARRMPTELLARLFQQRSQARLILFDAQAVPGTSIADLDPSLRGRFVRSSTEPEESVLRKMKILTEDDEGSVRASVGGVLLCTREPGAWLPGASIQAVRYRGSRPDANYQLDAREIRGPLDQQVNDAMAFVRRNMSVAARKGPGRIEFPQFSLRAVFEALVNAVAHRDYSVHGSRIRLFMFDDRLELFSPGSLPNTVTVDSLPLRQSTRNELVTYLLARCPVEGGEPGRTFMMEKRGEGVPIIIEETRRLAGMDPEYRVIDDAEVLLTIPAASPPDD